MAIRRLEALGTHDKMEGFWELKGGVCAIGGRRYIVFELGGMQDVEERLKKLASTLRSRLADRKSVV